MRIDLAIEVSGAPQDLVLKYYDQLSIKYRKMIPLKMVYIPVPPEE